MKLAIVATTIVVVLGVGCETASGWNRTWYEDIVLVQRSELIVVGRLERGSLLSTSLGDGTSQYHARLAITSVLKGAVAGEIPVIIYHGLTPYVGGDLGTLEIDDGKHVTSVGWRPSSWGASEDAIRILDTGSSRVIYDPLVPDAGEDNIWVLRRRAGDYGREAGTGDFGIVDPQDLRSLSLKNYFVAYLSADPEAGVKAELALHPEIAWSARRFLDHLEVQRILALSYAEAKIQRLIPFYLKGQSWGSDREARRGLVEAGEVSAPYLEQLFADPGSCVLKKDIIDLWGEMSYKGCITQLIELLQDHDNFWSAQHLEEGPWGHHYRSEVVDQRRRVYGEVLSAVVTLGKIGDERAVVPIEQTRARWRSALPPNRQIVEQCDGSRTN